jgi:hypothetical protein
VLALPQSQACRRAAAARAFSRRCCRAVRYQVEPQQPRFAMQRPLLLLAHPLFVLRQRLFHLVRHG